MALAEEERTAQNQKDLPLDLSAARRGLETHSCLIYTNASMPTLLYLPSVQGQSFQSKEGTQVTLVESEWEPGAPVPVSAHFTLVELLQLM